MGIEGIDTTISLLEVPLAKAGFFFTKSREPCGKRRMEDFSVTTKQKNIDVPAHHFVYTKAESQGVRDGWRISASRPKRNR